MKKLVITSVLLLLFMGISAFATETRVAVLGENGTVLVDDANIWEFPGRTFEFQNIAVGEFGMSDEFYEFGIHWKFGEEKPWVLATYFSTYNMLLPRGFDGTQFGQWDFLDNTHNRNIDLFYGRPLGGYHFGMHVGYWCISYEETDLDTAVPPVSLGKESTYLFNVAFGLTEASGAWDVAAHVQMGGWTDEDADGAPETEADGYSMFGVSGRYFWVQNPTMTLVPHAAAVFGTRGEIDNWVGDGDVTTTDITTESKGTAFEFGLGLNCTPATNVLTVADFGFAMDKVKTTETWTTTYAATAGTEEETESETLLPFWKIGLEADVFKWMDIRMGATSEWTSEKVEMADFETKEKYPSNHTYLGFGFHFGRLHIDTHTDPELFLEGFDFISGNGNNDMNFYISAVYEMFDHH